MLKHTNNPATSTSAPRAKCIHSYTQHLLLIPPTLLPSGVEAPPTLECSELI